MFKKIQKKLLDIISTGSDYVMPTAALALGVLNTGLAEQREGPDKSKILKTLLELTDQKYEEKKPMLGTFAAIGLGFVHSSEKKKKEKKDFLEYDTARDSIKEAIAISAGLGSVSEPGKIINFAMQDNAANVNFGACVGCALGKPFENKMDSYLEHFIESEYYDVASVGLISYGLRPLDETESKKSIKKIEKSIIAKEGYEKRVAAILSSALMSTNLKNKTEAMTNFHKYLKEGSWSIMATYPSYALLLLSDKEPLTSEKFDNYPLKILPPEMIYDFNGMLLLSTFLYSIADENLKKILNDEIIKELTKDVQRFTDTRFVYLVCKGLMAQFAEKPHEEFLKLLNDEFRPLIENEAEDWNTTCLKLGATLGIGFGIYLSRSLSEDDEIPEVVYQLLEKSLQCKDVAVQKAAIMSLLAIITNPAIFRKYLLISSFYELDQAAYTYYKITYLILSIYFILFAKFQT